MCSLISVLLWDVGPTCAVIQKYIINSVFSFVVNGIDMQKHVWFFCISVATQSIHMQMHFFNCLK